MDTHTPKKRSTPASELPIVGSMTLRRSIFSLCLAATTLLLGCQVSTQQHPEISEGRPFDYPLIRQLELGKTTPAETRRQFGEPKVEKFIANDFNEFSLMQYLYIKANPRTGQESYRILTLEFVDDTLNAYLYGTSFDGDLGHRDLAGRTRINRQASVGADVIREMGQPDGMAYYTTTLEAFAEGSGNEIWLYDEESRLEDNSIVTEKTLVGFDRDGVVDTITTSKTKIN